MSVTANQLDAALRAIGAKGGQGWTLATLAAGANDALTQAGITTRQGAASFVAQCMVESAYFRTTREYGGANTRYAPYYGRGFIQVTWESNYRAFGKWCAARGLVRSSNHFMVPNEDRLADPKWAWLGAVWYFTTHRHDLVTLANRGDNIKVGRAINRGTAHSSYAAYGEDHRQQAYRALLNAGISAPTKGSTAQKGILDMDEKKLRKIIREEARAAIYEWGWDDFGIPGRKDSKGKPLRMTFKEALVRIYQNVSR